MKVRHIILFVVLVMIAGPSCGQTSKEPHVKIAEIEIDPAQLEFYLDALRQQIEVTLRSEAGVVALYSVAEKENPAHITIFEIYRDAGAYQTHVETDHFKKYKTATKDLVKSLKLRDAIPILLGVRRADDGEVLFTCAELCRLLTDCGRAGTAICQHWPSI